VLSAGYYDAYYRQAQKARTLIVRDFEQAFQTVDAIVTPTSPTPAFKLAEKRDDPLAMYLEDVYTLPCNLAGLCGMSLPAAVTRPTETRPALPVGLQLLAPPFHEETLFALGAEWERACGGFGRAPSLGASHASQGSD
jgi:aspartyl-tRNA(Asn)/glutamyl-tRNA(Gln) amidotransferase subunit A